MRQFWKNILRLAWKNRGAMAGSALLLAAALLLNRLNGSRFWNPFA